MLDFFNYIIWFFTDGIYLFFVDAVSWLIQKSVFGFYKTTYLSVTFSWDVAQNIMADLNISAYLNGLYAHFNSEILNTFIWLRLPEFINTVITAYVTRFVIAFIGVGALA